MAGLAVIQDITGLRQIEANLAASEERLRYALEGTNDALWDWNLETGVIFFSPRYLSMLGYERKDHYATFERWLETVHPEDREKVRRAFDEARQSGLPYRIECRILTKDQDWCWMLNRGRLIAGEERRPSRIIRTLSDISEQKRANEQIRNLSNQIIHSQEEERRRISRELHDEAGQALTALRIYLDIIKKGLSEGNEKLRKELDEAIALSNQTLERIRSLAQGLRPAALETLGLSSALKGYCTEFAKKTHLAIEYEGESMESVPYEVGSTLYRFLQEGLTNVAKHAQADRVWVRLGYDGHRITLSIIDNGKGMVEKTVGRSGGIGLIGIEERLHYLGGELQITSAPGEGVRLIAMIPWEGRHDPNHDR